MHHSLTLQRRLPEGELKPACLWPEWEARRNSTMKERRNWGTREQLSGYQQCRAGSCGPSQRAGLARAGHPSTLQLLLRVCPKFLFFPPIPPGSTAGLQPGGSSTAPAASALRALPRRDARWVL